MGKNLDKYNEIMSKYRSGEFGNKALTLAEILKRGGEPNLMSLLSKEEMLELRDQSTGFYKKALNDEIIRKWGEEQK